MKRFIIFFILATLICNVTVEESARDNFEIARSLANFMEDHYSNIILPGGECDQITTEGFALGDTPYGRSPLQNLLGMAD